MSDRNLGNLIGGVVGAINILRNPDGNPISKLASTVGIPAGVASVITGAVSASSAVLNPLAKIIQDPNKTPLLNLFSAVSPPAGGPPYENVLEQFASYVPLWTLAVLEPSQFNDPSTYREKPTAIKHIILASAGRFDAQREPTASGTPEYFIDNINLEAQISPGPRAGNANVFTVTFDVFEPYSMGLFLLSMQTASINAGYTNWNEAPYLLKLEFRGIKDSGAVFTGSEQLSKYFTIKITDVTFKVDEGGSKYNVKATSMPSMGFADSVTKVTTDIVIAGENVKEVLSSGERSLCSVLNANQIEMVKAQQQEIADIYSIVFPMDPGDGVGLTVGAFEAVLKATADPKKQDKAPLVGRTGQVSEDFGFGPVGKSSMGFTNQSGGNYLYKLEGDVIDAATGRVQREKMSIDPKQRAFTFAKEDKITEMIQMIVLSSEYGVDALDPDNLDAEGQVTWFKLDVQIQLLDYDRIRNVRARKFIYRVLPFKIPGSVFSRPSSVPAGQAALTEIISKRYDYIYTGQNNSILKFDLQFDGMAQAGTYPRSPNKSEKVANTDTNNSSDSPEVAATAGVGAAPAAVVANTGSKPLKPDFDIKTQSASGEKTVQQLIADAFQTAQLKANKDLIGVKIDILGDPYFLADNGNCGSYVAKTGPNNQITADGTMNYEGAVIFAYLTWRNPVEPNLGTTGQGGLYNFQHGGAVSPFSGIYRVIGVVNKFSGGTFQQTLDLNREPQKDQSIAGQDTISKQNQLLYDTKQEAPKKTSPTDDPDIAKTDQENVTVTGGSTGPDGAATPRLITIDVTKIQQEAKVAAYLDAKNRGLSEVQAQAAEASAGNLAGAEALSRVQI